MVVSPCAARVILERLKRVAQRMLRAGGNEDNVVGADEVSLALDRQCALAMADDVDVVGRRVRMHTPARAAAVARPPVPAPMATTTRRRRWI